MAFLGLSVQSSPFKPTSYVWFSPHSFSSRTFWASSGKALHRGEDCKTRSIENASSSLAVLGDPIKQISSHERKLFSSGLQQKIEEDSIYGWNAEIDAIKALKAKNAYNSYKKISAANCSVSASTDRKVKDENSDVPIEVNTRMMRERVTSSYSATTCISGGSLSSKSKPPHNPNRGEKKDVGNWREYKKHLPQLSVGINHSRNNEVTSINKVDGPNVSHYKPLSKGSNLNEQLSSKIVNAKFEKANKLWQGSASNQIRDSVNGTDTKVVTVKAKSVILEQATIKREKNAVKSVATDFVNGTETKIVSDKGTGLDQITLRERLGAMYEKVHIVDNLSAAKEVVSKLTSQYKHLVHACDTEVANIDVKQQTPVDHGEVICFSIYSGPEADFGDGKSCIWVDVLDGGGKDLLVEFAPFFQDPSIRKVWHNYSFDNHVMENYGFEVSGFHADTMHMARLWDSSRRILGGYSLEALTGDSHVMCDARLVHAERLFHDEGLFGKISMKTIFGRKKLKKDGTEGKVIMIPSVEELQRTERELWICYSALDSISTLMLYESLKKKLSKRIWTFDGVRKGSMYEFYEKYWRPFGEVLVQMETEGVLVDRAYLAEIEKVAKAEQLVAVNRFRNWAAKYCADAKYMNVGSDTQLRQLFFGGIQNRKNVDESLPNEKEFKVPNVDKVIEEGKKAPTKFRKIHLHRICDPINTEIFTASGWPSVSGDALKALAGKVSADFDIFDEVDGNAEEVPETSVDEALTTNNEALSQNPEISAYGTAYHAFGGGQKGIEACHAIAALCEVCSIDSLISNFILPLQGHDVSGENGRIHCSLNINTETGRLSARRPNLQNQPALEKDRYKIRQAFVAAEGNSLIVADYGQLELRILAHLANCKSMLGAFEAGGDFHSRTAMNMYSHIREAVEKGQVLLEWHPQPGEDKPPVPLLKDAFGSERRKAKMLNFSIAYGKTTIGLSRDWKVSVKEAKETVERWYSDRKEVSDWQEQRRFEAREFGCVHTLLGRARWFPSVKNATGSVKGHIERAAINTPVQGSAADVAMCAMLEISKNARLKELGWKLLLQVHDEVILEGPEESEKEAMAIVVHCMSNPFNGKNILRVGLSVDAKCAKNWYSAK
ncbi:DNA polymerase I B, chloroplastic/mitochondrial [Solanum pennellii]|uniref:DNA polymerase I B, chloroplastic/mitochondrial n=1 Tax=Solanum pennellii TaxID=28526 RepID=A0ABM1H8L4_SOLPN|nr:DNA polymerase I B, chloroplastic/mitochondrial [Solanum pennellii]